MASRKPPSTEPPSAPDTDVFLTVADIDPAVHHPKHYNLNPSGVEAIDVIEHMTFNVGTAVKYLWRAGLKDGEPSVRDLQKAQWYITREIHRLRITAQDKKNGD